MAYFDSDNNKERMILIYYIVFDVHTMPEDFPINPQTWAPKLKPMQYDLYVLPLAKLASICFTSSPSVFPTAIAFKDACLYVCVKQAVFCHTALCLCLSTDLLMRPSLIWSWYQSWSYWLLAISTQYINATTIRRFSFR